MKMNHHIWSRCREHETMCSGLLSWGGPDRPSMDQVIWIGLSRLLLSKYCVRYNLDCSSDIWLGGESYAAAYFLCLWLVQSMEGPLIQCNSLSKQSLDSNGTCRPAEEVGYTYKTTVV